MIKFMMTATITVDFHTSFLFLLECRMKYVKEPPKITQLQCNPFRGEGFQLQCALEISQTVRDKVTLNWRISTNAGDWIRWDTPWLKSIMRTNSSTSITRKKIITSTLTVTWKETKPKSLKIIHKSLLGGRIYCQPEIIGKKDIFLPSNILVLSPGHTVAKCTHGTIHAVNSSKCALLVWSKSTMEETRRKARNVTRWIASQQEQQGSEDNYDNTTLDGIVFVDDANLEPFIYTMAALGITLLILGMLLPAILLGHHIRKKCKLEQQFRTEKQSMCI